MMTRRRKNSSKIWKMSACAGLCLLAAVLFNAAAVAEDREKTVITLKAVPVTMVQGEEMPAPEVKASLKGDGERILDDKSKYTVQNLLDSFNKGENYQITCSADGKIDGEYPIDLDVSDQVKESVLNEWLGKVDVKVKDATFTVKNKYGEWDGEKFKKTDGSYASNEFIVSKGKTYYFDGNGQKLTGEHRIGMKKYVFGAEGEVQSEETTLDLNKPMLALTFDDGPGSETGKILDVLEKHGARATFFMLGKKVERYPETVKKMQQIGCELGNHSTTHTQLTKLTPEQIKNEIGTTSDRVTAATGGFGTTVIRPPYGAMNDAVKANAGQPLILWSVDTLDWKTRNVQSTIDSVLNSAKDGDIVLMHDIHKQSVEAAVQMIPMLIEKGYQLVTVSELAEARGVQMEDGGRYTRFRK